MKKFFQEVNQYWFGFGSPVAFCVFRILMAGFTTMALIMQLHMFNDFFAMKGITPPEANIRYLGHLPSVILFGSHEVTIPYFSDLPRFNLLAGITSDQIIWLFFLATIFFGILTTVGYKTRISSILFAMGVVSIQIQNTLVLYGADTVMRACVVYLALGPSGAACSIDRLIRVWKGKETSLPRVSLWPQRLVQFQMALIYFTTVWFKWEGPTWRDGSATWYPNRLNEFVRFPYPHFLIEMPFVRITTYATLIVELALASLVFAKPLRKYVLIAGLGMHGFISYTMNVPVFMAVMCSMYITFYMGEEITEWSKRVGQRLSRFKRTISIPANSRLSDRAKALLAAADPWGLVAIEPAAPGEKADNPLLKLAPINPLLLLFLPFSKRISQTSIVSSGEVA